MIGHRIAQPEPSKRISDRRSTAEAGLDFRIQGFLSITLAQCNALAAMQDRVDNKYLVDLNEASGFLDAIRTGYTVLEIDNRREFRYSSCYYDDRYACYFEHHQGRRQRLKVRTREYVDGGGQKFFEIKLKGSRGRTVKHRCPADDLIVSKVAGEELELVRSLYRSQYHKEMTFDLRPALIVQYRRCTLVASDGSERVTIDTSLGFSRPDDPDSPVRLGEQFIVIETKSSNGKGIASDALKTLRVRKASKCSKYCIGVNLTGGVTKGNSFLPVIRRAKQCLEEERA